MPSVERRVGCYFYPTAFSLIESHQRGDNTGQATDGVGKEGEEEVLVGRGPNPHYEGQCVCAEMERPKEGNYEGVPRFPLCWLSRGKENYGTCGACILLASDVR